MSEDNDFQEQEISVDDDGSSAGAAAEQKLADGDDPSAVIDRLNEEISRLKDEVLRAQAEADNTRKRAERDVTAAHKYGLEKFASELLPVKDSMDLGLSAATAATEVESLAEGMELTVKMLEDFFAKTGIRAVDPLGERFDPDFHQAMTMEASAESVPGTVLRVMQKGYVLHERLIRPALVVVAKAAGADEA